MRLLPDSTDFGRCLLLRSGGARYLIAYFSTFSLRVPLVRGGVLV